MTRFPARIWAATLNAPPSVSDIFRSAILICFLNIEGGLARGLNNRIKSGMVGGCGVHDSSPAGILKSTVASMSLWLSEANRETRQGTGVITAYLARRLTEAEIEWKPN